MLGKKGYVVVVVVVVVVVEANEGILGFVQVLLCLPHLDEALPSNNIYGAAVIDEDLTNVISREVYRISSDVCSNNEGIIVWVVLKP